jgi:hypothetical protein
LRNDKQCQRVNGDDNDIGGCKHDGPRSFSL